MLEFSKLKIWGITLIILVGVLLAVPSLFPKEQVAAWPSWVPKARISLGLDIAGGSQLLLEADTVDAAKQRLQAMEDQVTTELRRGDPKIEIGDVSTSAGRLSFLVRNPAQVDAAVERLRPMTAGVGLTGSRDWDVGVIDTTRIVMTPTADGSAKALKDSLTVELTLTRRPPKSRVWIRARRWIVFPSGIPALLSGDSRLYPSP